MPDVNLKELRYLVAVADHLHFGRAAEACFVSQPTLSTQLKKLEEQLGVQLVERTNKQVMLTPVGREIVSRARRVLGEVAELIAQAESASDPLSGALRLGAIPTLGPYLLPHLVPALRDKLPRLQPLLYEDQTERLLGRLRRGEIDGALMATPVEGRDLVVSHLFDEPFVLAVPKGHVLSRKAGIDFDDLRPERLLLLEEGHCLRDQALEVCALAGAAEATEFRATSLETLRQMVAAGGGVTLLPALAAEANATVPNHNAVVLERFRAPVPEREIALFWRKGSARAPALEAVAEITSGLEIVQHLRDRYELRVTA